MGKRTKAQKRAEKKQAKQAVIHRQRVAAKRKRQKKLITNWSIVIVALLLLIFGVQALGKRPAKYDDFAKCLAESGTTMYGADWCGFCQDQKRLFGRSFKHVAYENCDFSNECALNQVQGFPTWIYPDGERTTGVQSFEFLAEKSGCELP